METDGILDTYCQQMSAGPKIKQLTPEETEAYFSEYEQVCQDLDGDPENKTLNKRKAELTRLITTSCLPYVLRLARNYTRTNDDKELMLELLAEGNVGLCLAVTKFDWRRGVPFHSYAANWIKANYQPVMLSHRNMVKNSGKHSVYLDGFSPGQRLPDILQEEPSVDEPTQDAMRVEQIRIVREQLRNLPAVEQAVLRLCEGFNADKSFKFTQIGRMFGVGFSSSVGKSYYSEASSSIAEALLSNSINS